MWRVFRARWQQGYRTIGYPKEAAVVPDRFRGLPVIEQEACEEDCCACADVCPTDAIFRSEKLTIDLGRCLFCNACVEACPTEARFFGDLDDPESTVSRLLASRTYIKLREDMLTNPKTIYLPR